MKYPVAIEKRVRILHYSVGWSGGAKVLCVSRHLGVQLILTYSWSRPPILVAGKGREGMFLFLLFLHFHSVSTFFPGSLFYLFYYLFWLFLPFSGRRHKKTKKCWCVVKLQHNQIHWVQFMLYVPLWSLSTFRQVGKTKLWVSNGV